MVNDRAQLHRPSVGGVLLGALDGVPLFLRHIMPDFTKDLFVQSVSVSIARISSNHLMNNVNVKKMIRSVGVDIGI